jgi:hypothetical protein
MLCTQDVSIELWQLLEIRAKWCVAIWTGLSRNLDAEGEAAIRKTSPFWKTHDQGAATVLVAALDPAMESKFAGSI